MQEGYKKCLSNVDTFLYNLYADTIFPLRSSQIWNEFIHMNLLVAIIDEIHFQKLLGEMRYHAACSAASLLQDFLLSHLCCRV